MTAEEILQKIPGSWSEFKLKDYIRSTQFERLVKSTDDEVEALDIDVENMFRLIASIVDVPVETVRALSWADQKRAMDRLKFMDKEPGKKENCVLDWKHPDDLSYADFVAFITLQEDMFNNMPLLIQSMIKNKLSEDEIKELTMDEIHYGFFLQRRTYRKHRSHTLRCLAKRAIRQALKEMWQRLKRLFKARKRSKNKT